MAKVNQYELMMALKPLLPDDVRKAMHKNVVSLIDELGGSVAGTDVWGKRYLAYKIMGHNEGYYIVYKFELPTEALTEFKRQLSLKSEILRFVTVRIDDPAQYGTALKKKEIESE